MKWTYLLLFMLIVSSTLNAGPLQYGELFVLEKDDQPKLNALGVAYLPIVDAALVDSHALQFYYRRRLGLFFELGGEYSYKNSALSASGRQLESALKGDGITQTVQRPTSSFYLTGSLILLHNNVNFFNRLFGHSNLKINTGLGQTYYKDKTLAQKKNVSSAFFEGHYDLELSSHFALVAKLRRTFDSLFSKSSFSYTQFGLGLEYIF